ncbi:hypothetical protein CKO15_04565 [Halorhodospira abdelmalekii]|uniref:TolC family protein n=1 Tax=Halorhodospira abdelmalekii TaxID=421629 RepID=UPI0019065080|nr:TolC family protein [Halorhodospira abdelmalekii]MBK1734569.1 hypothetical protein [Halorhodospira abdelmalekii]
MSQKTISPWNRRRFQTTALALLAFAGTTGSAAASLHSPQPLSLAQAEQLAVERNPAIAGYRAEAAALRERVPAARSLPDPELTLGAMNVPIDSLGIGDDPMTQLRIGLRQRIPTGRDAAEQRLSAELQVAQARVERVERTTRRKVRHAYYELLHRHLAMALLKENRHHFEAMQSAAEREFAAGRVSRQDSLQANLELERLEDRIVGEGMALEEARAELARWIGAEAARQPLPESVPEMRQPPKTAEQARRHLDHHPRLAEAIAAIGVGHAGVAKARSAYRPNWAVEVTYGHRRATGMDPSSAPDLLSAMVMVQLPLFTANRQDRHLAAGQQRLYAAQAQQQEIWLELERDLTARYARWHSLDERSRHYHERIVKLAAENAEAAHAAYRAETIGFTALQRARIDALETRLAALRIDIQRAQAQAELLYLTGEVES